MTVPEINHAALLGVDWGKARLGVAVSPAGTSLAFPVETVAAGPAALERLKDLVTELNIGLCFVGLPLDLAGSLGLAARDVSAHASQLAATIAPVSVRLVDERLSTAGAVRGLQAAGRSARQQRSVVDQAAAVDILQRVLDAGFRDGSLVGELVKVEEL
ncbi:MAG: Holliday junction resolvase RuvX [Arachnia propionica]|nr:MAG: Holliday junction resolvase RuvX [Arachnia propionica]